MTDIVFFL